MYTPSFSSSLSFPPPYFGVPHRSVRMAMPSLKLTPTSSFLSITVWMLLLGLSASLPSLHSRLTPVRTSLLGKWALTEKGGKGREIAATLPGEVHTALHTAGVIPDPYYADNVTALQWVRWADWTYARTFSPPSLSSSSSSSTAASGGKHILVMDGIDTVAHVVLNGEVVAKVDNSFRQYIVDVSAHIQHGLNTIELQFFSAAAYAEEKGKAYPYSVPGFDAIYGGDAYRNFIRKSQCHFGWDWGPAFETMGVYGQIQLLSIPLSSMSMLDMYVDVSNDARPTLPAHAKCPTCDVADLSSLTTFTISGDVRVVEGEDFTADMWDRMEVEGVMSSRGGEESFTFHIGKGKMRSELSHPHLHSHHGCTGVEGKKCDQLITVLPFRIDIPAKKVKMWYPAGYGDQPMYDFSVLIKAKDTGGSAEEVVSSLTQSIGFKVSEVVTDPLHDGKTFFFRVNGIPIFAKGSNLIPFDSFESKVTKERVYSMLESAKKAGQNMLRIWGGGIYQREDVYKYADENGLMLWQEFMFACALYPRNQAFLSSVYDEVQYQVRRLVHHPSIVLLSGNNENQATAQSAGDLYVVDYSQLYDDTVMTAVRSVTRSTSFWPSSPSNGAMVDDMEDNMYIQMWGDSQSTRYGDIHRYDYFDDCLDVSLFPTPRFASEFGYQSHPSKTTYTAAIPASQLHINSSLLQKRNHHPDGDEQMLAMASRYFPLSSLPLTSPTHFDDVIYIYQLTQALCMRAETEHYRRHRSNSTAYTMGTLYWQLNDIWQAPTWASVEYSGNWKMLHYHVQDYYSSLALSVYKSGEEVVVYAHNDELDTAECEVKVEVYNDKLEQTHTAAFTHTAVRLSSEKVGSITIGGGDHLVALADAVCTKGGKSEKQALPRASSLIGKAPSARASCTKVKLETTDMPLAKEGEQTSAKLRLSSPSSLALFVAIQSSQPGVFSDNGFIMKQGEVVEVEFEPVSSSSSASATPQFSLFCL
uniref:beta-mannosidase n=1 Tax=Palpitomonas bilix TaxID=652834 RepID=A0A7S3LUS4_9EUKA